MWRDSGAFWPVKTRKRDASRYWPEERASTVVSRAVVPGQQPLQHSDLDAVDANPEQISEHLADPLQANVVDDVGIHGPALQAVDVLVQPLEGLRDEAAAALQAPMYRCPDLDHFPLDA